MAKLIQKDRMNISRKARHALGKLSALLALRSVDSITSDRARELCAELYLAIDSICIGAGAGDKEIQMEALEMVPLGKEPSYHERLKESYYILQRYWRKNR